MLAAFPPLSLFDYAAIILSPAPAACPSIIIRQCLSSASSASQPSNELQSCRSASLHRIACTISAKSPNRLQGHHTTAGILPFCRGVAFITCLSRAFSFTTSFHFTSLQSADFDAIDTPDAIFLCHFIIRFAVSFSHSRHFRWSSPAIPHYACFISPLPSFSPRFIIASLLNSFQHFIISQPPQFTPV